MAGVLGIVGYFRGIFSGAHVRYPLDEHERLGCRLGRPLGQVPAAPSHGLCRSAGKLPSQSRRSRASSPKGGAKSRLPLWGALVPSGHRSALDRAGRRECHAKGMTERARRYRPGKTLRCFPSFLSCAARHKGKAVGLCPTTRNPLKRVDRNFHLSPRWLSSRTPPLSSPRPPPRSGPGCAASVSAPPLSSRSPPRVSAPRPRGWPKAPAPRLPGRSPR